MSKKAEIRFVIHLDEKKVPRRIEWGATDAPFSGTRQSNALMVSLWDSEDRDTLSIDLWTPEMTVDEMGVHCVNTLLRLAETYQRATSNQEIAGLIREWGRELGEKVEEQARSRREQADPKSGE